MTPERPGPAFGRSADRYSSAPSTAGPWRRLTPRQRRLTIWAAVLVALAFAAGFKPSTKSVHTFTKASDYNSQRERGCTNSGPGCHAAEKQYADFNAYHRKTKCTVCHKYDGVGCIPCHKGNQHECTGCHDGSVPGASDAVRLTDPYPRGHYRETSHTAIGTDMTKAVRAAEGGKAKLACKECHSRDLRAAHTQVPVVKGSSYGPDIGCGECHNDEKSGSVSQVKSKWKKRGCPDCHEPKSSGPMHSDQVAARVEGKSAKGCGSTGQGCHADNDLHALHPDTPKNCSGPPDYRGPKCHDLTVESDRPKAKTCGQGRTSCHPAYRNDAFSHKEDRTVHSPKTRAPAADSSYMGIACGACHDMAPDGRSLADEHALPTSARSLVRSDPCRNCHNNPASEGALRDKWAARDSGTSCFVCHDGLALVWHDRDLSGLHTVAGGSAGCADTGIGCHPTADLSAVGYPSEGAIHRDCLRCHDRTASRGNLAYDPSRSTCGWGRDCHAAAGAYDPETGYHRGDDERTDGSDSSHHEAGSAQAADRLTDGATGVSTRCDACHSMALGPEHARPNATLGGVDDCAGCHNAREATARIVKTDWQEKGSEQACAVCHTSSRTHKDSDTMHTATQYSDRDRLTTTGCVRGACHASADVRVLHKRTGCTTDGCHTSKGDIRGTRILSCGGTDALSGGSCHTAGRRHRNAAAAHAATERDPYGNAEPASCLRVGCHATLDVRDLHPADGCSTAGCHVQGGPTYMSCGGADGQQSCHTTGDRHVSDEASHQAREYDDAGNPRAGSCQKAGCHATVDARQLHAASGCAIQGCHARGGLLLMGCGGADGQQNCHTTRDRHLAIDRSHQATELGMGGLVQPGACTGSGCHATSDVRSVHATPGCAIPGCHVSGGPTLMTCGGASTSMSCHNPPPPSTCFVPSPGPAKPDRADEATKGSDLPTGQDDEATSAPGPSDSDSGGGEGKGESVPPPDTTPNGTGESSATAENTATSIEPPPTTEDSPQTPEPPAKDDKDRTAEGDGDPPCTHSGSPASTASGIVRRRDAAAKTCLECHAVGTTHED